MLALILVILPLLFAALAQLSSEKISKYIALVGTVIELLLVGYIYKLFTNNPTNPLFNWHYEWIPQFGASFHLNIDGINFVLVILTAITLPLIIWSSFNRKIATNKAFFSLALIMQSALMGVFLAKDALLFYVFWELALIPIYFICLLYGEEGRQQITLKFFLYTLFGSLFMLIALIFIALHSSSPSFDMDVMYYIASKLSLNDQIIVLVCLYLAFAIKIPVFPLHTWQADTYVNAPTQGTMLLSGIMLKMGLFGLLRWMIPLAPLAWQKYSFVLILISVISVVYAALMAIAQKNFKRLFAYTSMSHVGLIAAGILAFNLHSIQGAIFQMFSHGIVAIGLFFVADIIINRLQTDEMETIEGIRNKDKLFSVLFLIVLLASVALPLTSSFVGEFLLLFGLFSFNEYMAFAAGLTIIFGAVYMLRAYHQIMNGKTNDTANQFTRITKQETAILVVICSLIFILGIFPDLILKISHEEVKCLIQIVQASIN